MKKSLIILCLLLASLAGRAQVVLNEVYTDPGSGKHEFFEIFNYGAPVNTDNLTLVVYFDSSTTRGFYVFDLPQYTLTFQQYFVIAAALPFNYQGVNNSNSAQYNWNNIASLSANGGSLKRWVLGTANLTDGNASYDQQAIPPNFNDLFYHCSGGGNPSFSIFLYKNGVLKNTFFGGANGSGGAPATITSMPALYVDMLGASPDFTINFPGYANIQSEWFGPETGNDNGYTRTRNGLCKQWQKAAAAVAHTPGYTNGSPIGTMGELTIMANITRATVPGDSSTINYNIISGPVAAFPVDIITYLDVGVVPNDIDFSDQFLDTVRENTVADGPFQTKFLPQPTQVVLMAQTNAGCLDQVIIVPNLPGEVLPLKPVALQGTYNDDKASLQWSTDQNESVNKFDIERSTDAVTYSTAGVVFGSNKQGAETYSFIESIAAEKIFYRLKVTDKAGNTTYSKTLAFQNNELTSNEIKVLNNPVTDKLSFIFNSTNNQWVTVSVIDITGKIITAQKISAVKGKNISTIPIDACRQNGIYLLDLYDGLNRKRTKFIRM